jgi:hypothetical protein
MIKSHGALSMPPNYFADDCPDFPTNLVSLRLLEACCIDWNHQSGQLMFYGDSDILSSTRRIHGEYVLEHREAEVYTTVRG